ncbi:MAG: hypothetical protein AAF437_10850 [Pseudomonadota bacterium]
MFVHRFHWPYYLQVPVYVWPILFFNLWRVDRWSAATGKRAFVVPDEFGVAWVPYHEGMEIRYFVHNRGETQCPEPYTNVGIAPGWLQGTLEHPTHLFSADASASWGPGTALPQSPQGSFLPSRQICEGAFGPNVRRDPGWRPPLKPTAPHPEPGKGCTSNPTETDLIARMHAHYGPHVLAVIKSPQIERSGGQEHLEISGR